MSHGLVPKAAAEATRSGLRPIGRGLAALGVTPDHITGAGLFLMLVGSVLLSQERPLVALVILIVGSIADTLDGVVARATRGGTRLGAFLDSTADRIADSALFGGAAYLGAERADPILLFSSLTALAASLLVPYVRAKAESLGVSATAGPAPREARLVILLVGIGLWSISPDSATFFAFFQGAVALIALLATITFLQRVIVVARALSATH